MEISNPDFFFILLMEIIRVISFVLLVNLLFQ